MTKKFYDIKPKEHRSIRDIPLDIVRAPEKEKEIFFAPKKQTRKTHSKPKKEEIIPVHIVETPQIEDVEFEEWNKTRRFKYVWIIATVLFLGLLYSAFSWMSSATITLKLVKHPVTLQKTKIALKEIKNELVEFDIEQSSSTAAGGFVEANSKASGTIVLYNNFSSSAVKIPNGTSLVAPNSLVYKTSVAVTIPGMTTKSGKSIPGSVDVKIEGEKAGPEYNAKFTDFNVQSFKGTPKYEKIYGRSKTEIAGGLNGKIPKISKEAIDALVEGVKRGIASSSESTIKMKTGDIKDNLVYVPHLSYLDVQNPVQKVTDDGKEISVSIKARGVIILLDKKSLSEQITKENVFTVKGLGSRVKFDIDTSSLKATMQQDLDINSIKKNLVYLFFSGETSLTSALDERAIVSAVSGLSKVQALKVIPDLIESEATEIVTRPWWLDRLPLNKGKIRVISQ